MKTGDGEELYYADEYNPMHVVYHEGRLFTGVTRSEREATEYVEDKAHGPY